MRIDAHDPNCFPLNWRVFHVPAAKELELVVWVDDVAAQYEEFSGWAAEAVIVTRQAQRILIDATRRLVLIDPVDDDEPEAVTTELSIASPIEA